MAIKIPVCFIMSSKTELNNLAKCWKDLFISRNLQLNMLFKLIKKRKSCYRHIFKNLGKQSIL